MQEHRDENVTRQRHDRVRTISQDITVDRGYFDLVAREEGGRGVLSHEKVGGARHLT